MTLLVGTQNPGKLIEIKSVIGDLPYQIVSLADVPRIVTPPEDTDSYSENAIIKARSYALQTSFLTLADDSGLEVDALHGAPGVLSARYAGEGASDADRRALLLAELRRSHSDSRGARFVCAVAIANASGQVINVCEGNCIGKLITEERGEGGFGYDPLFVPEGYELTFAELPSAVKNRISHRGRALAKAREFLLTHVTPRAV